MDQQLREHKNRGSFLFPFELYQMNNQCGGLSVSCHWHPDVEILYLKKGTLNILINGTSYLFEEETIIFLNREEIHSMFSTDPETVYDAAVFPLEFLSFDTMDYCQQKYLLPLIQGRLAFPRSLMPGDACFLQTAAQMNELSKLHSSFPDGYQFATKAVLFQIISSLILANLLLPCSSGEASLNHKKQETMRRILSYINEHLSEPITLSEISSDFYMTPNYFCRFFKNSFGSTFTAYLNSLRLEKSCILLAETDLSIIEVCLRCGYENPSYFIRMFKQKYGLTPSHYRKNVSL